MKGGIILSAIGYIQVHTYTSNSLIPLKDTAVAITEPSGSAIALRLTNRSGALDEPISVTVPDLASSQAPNPGIQPYTLVNIYVKKTGYEEIEVENVQVFANTVTLQNFEMIPIAEYPQYWNQTEIFTTPSQNL